jgi:hypothetical protein
LRVLLLLLLLRFPIKRNVASLGVFNLRVLLPLLLLRFLVKQQSKSYVSSCALFLGGEDSSASARAARAHVRIFYGRIVERPRILKNSNTCWPATFRLRRARSLRFEHEEAPAGELHGELCSCVLTLYFSTSMRAQSHFVSFTNRTF